MEPKVLDMFSNERYKRKATSLAKRMTKEHELKEKLYLEVLGKEAK
ncbi:MAG: hypothetical protein AAGF85_07445 [Bacteroidota bacterium]